MDNFFIYFLTCWRTISYALPAKVIVYFNQMSITYCASMSYIFLFKWCVEVFELTCWYPVLYVQLNLLLLPPQPPYKGTKKSAHFLAMWITLFTNIFIYFIFGTTSVQKFPQIVTESFVCAAHRLIPVALKRVFSRLHL